LDKHRQKTLYKLFNQQCLTTLDHEAFKRSIEKEKEKKSKDTNQTDDENEQPEINTLSTIDFKISYDDFKLGIDFLPLHEYKKWFSMKLIFLLLKVTNDLRIPCMNIQLHALCKLLDPESNGKIDYRRFTPQYLESHIK